MCMMSYVCVCVCLFTESSLFVEDDDGRMRKIIEVSVLSGTRLPILKYMHTDVVYKYNLVFVVPFDTSLLAFVEICLLGSSLV